MSLLELRGITKRFGDLVANDRISLTVEPGRVHALVGENGAGKTTLMTMIAGTARPTDGEILFDGEVTEMTSPQKAARLGIGMVHQHFKLVPSLTVAANVFLGSELVSRTGSLDTAAMEARVTELSQKFGLAINPTDVVENLSVGERQRVEVLKALSHDTRLLILDEPTAVLTPSEADELFVVVRELAKNGCAVLFISHKLDEVLAIADIVTVIRDGRIIATLPAAGLSEADIATMMVGREVLLRIEHTEAKPAEEVLDVRDLTVIDDRGVTAVNKLSLSVRSGEIVGIAGVEGNGQAELAEVISGLARPDAGSVRLKGEDVTRASVRHRRKLGLAYIPEDRHDVGTGPSLSVAENLAATHLTPPVARAGWVSNRAMNALAVTLIKKFDIRGATTSTATESLSGGNMQKVVIAREFEAQPALLMVSQPTRGVDVGAMEFVHNALVSARDAGAGVLLISADLTEVMSLSDRLLVIHRGRIVAEFTHDTMTETAIGLAMAGLEADEDEVAKAEAQHEQIAQAVATGEAEARSSRIAEAVRKAREDLAGDSEEIHGVGVAAPIEPIDTSAVRVRSPLNEFTTKLFANSVQPVLAIILALLIGVFIIAGLGVNPLDAYAQLFLSSFTSPQGIGAMIAQAVPLLILSAGVIISFRAGFFNIGGEGQLYVGALAGAWVGFTFKDLPGPVMVLAIFVWAFVVAALWGLIPGALLALWDVNIIVTTLMMSSIAMLLTAYLVTGPMRDPEAGTAASPKVADQAMLPMISDEYGLGLDLIIALVIVIVMGLVLTRSVWGLRVRQLGELNRFADYTGVSRKAMSMQVMAISGGVSGLAGALFVIGPNGGRFLQTFSPGYGFLAITVALLARLNPWASIVAAIFYANMMAGSNQMQINTNVPFPLVNVLQGLIILLITGTFAWNRRHRRKTPDGETAPPEPATSEPGSSAPTPERSAA